MSVELQISQNYPSNGPPPAQTRGTARAVIGSVDNATSPHFAKVYVNNNLPGEAGYTVPAGWGPFVPGGTVSPGTMYFYDNASGVGGSYVIVDLDRRAIISLAQGVSTSQPTAVYAAITDHLHDGNLNPTSGIMDPGPIVLGTETEGTLPYGQESPQVQGIVDSNGNVISTSFPGELTLQMSGTYAGQWRQAIGSAATSVDSIKATSFINLAVGQWYWEDFTSQFAGGAGTNGWGPAFFDNNGNWVWVSFNNGTGELIGYNGSSQSNLIALASNQANVAGLHTFSLGIQFQGGTSYRVQGVVDGEIVCDFTWTSSPLNNGQISAGFMAATSEGLNVYHTSYDFYGSTTATFLTGNPNPNTSPVFAVDPSAFTYVGAGTGGAYDAISSFELTLGNPAWLWSVRLFAVAHSGTPPNPLSSYSGAIMKGDLTPNSSGTYVPSWDALSAGTQYDLYIAYVDVLGNVTPATLVGTTAANPIAGIGTPMPSGIQASGPAITSASMGTPVAAGAATYNIPYTFTVSDFSGSNPPWFLGFQVFIRSHGDVTGTIAPAGVISPNTGSPFNTFDPSVIVGANSGVWDIGLAYLGIDQSLSTIIWDSALETTPTLISPITIGSVGSNLVFDSDFSSATWGDYTWGTAAQNKSRAIKATYWNTYRLGEYIFFQKGSLENDVNQQASNSFCIETGYGPKAHYIQSELISVVPNVTYTLSCYIDCLHGYSGGAGSNQPIIRIVSSDFTTTYITLTQAFGKNSRVSTAWACPTGVTQVAIEMHPEGVAITSGYLVKWTEPMFEVNSTGNPSPYTQGPQVAGETPASAPPATDSISGDPTSGTGPASTEFGPSGYGGTPHHGSMSVQTQGVVNDNAGAGQLNVLPPGGVVNDLPHINSSVETQTIIEKSTASLLVQGRNLVNNGGFDYQVTGANNTNPPLMTNFVPGWYQVSLSGETGAANSVVATVP